MNPKEKKALKKLANALKLPYEHVKPEELLNEVNKLPYQENLAIQLRYGFLDDCQDISGCALRLRITPTQANKLLTIASRMLLTHKNNYYHKNMTFADDYEEKINELDDLNVRSYNALIRAGKEYISDIENMSLMELLELPGLKEKDYQLILLALEAYRKSNK